MKKLSVLGIVFIMTCGIAFAQDATADSAKESVAQEEAKESSFKIGGSVDVKEKGYIFTKGKDTTTDQQVFNYFKNKVNAKGSVLFNFNDTVELGLYAHARDIVLKSNAANTVGFDDGSLNVGLSIDAALCDAVSLNATLFQWDYFKINSPVGVGLGGSLGFDFSIEKAFLDLSLWDEVSTRFAKNDAGEMGNLLLNYLDYGFRFNFFNFINKKANSGIYAEGEFELDLDTTDGNYVNNYLYNEFFIGLISAPVSFFECYLAAAIFAEADWNQDMTQVAQSGTYKIGFQTGCTFKYKGFSVKFVWEPKFYCAKDTNTGSIGVREANFARTPINQYFALQVAYKFKAYNK